MYIETMHRIDNKIYSMAIKNDSCPVPKGLLEVISKQKAFLNVLPVFSTFQKNENK